MFRTCDPVKCTLLSSADSVWSDAALLLVFSYECKCWIISCCSNVLELAILSPVSGHLWKEGTWVSRSICGPSQCGSGSACLTPWVCLLQSNNIPQTMRIRTQPGERVYKYGGASRNRIHGSVRQPGFWEDNNCLRTPNTTNYHLPCHHLVNDIRCRIVS